MAVTIRPACSSDAQYLPDIERDAGAIYLTVADLAWIARDEVMPPEDHLPLIAAGTVWVADDADVGVVGFLTAERFGAALHIWETAVLREYQQRGIGKRMIAASAQHARTTGLTAITLTTFRDVPWNAPFYARNGFRIVEGGALDERLTAVLKREVENGLESERRCAMRRPVVRL
jgi:GNAT superfamily N-acetyltransferase